MSTERTVPKLKQLIIAELCRTWHPSCDLSMLPLDLAKLVWAELKAQFGQQGVSPPCSAMYPFVRCVWRIEELDLSDSGKWVIPTSLQALSYVSTLRAVRLTACRFVTDAALNFVASLRLDTLDVSWTQVSDAGISDSIVRCPTLTSINLTGLQQLTDRGVASLLSLRNLKRLALACTGITDAALDYLTYYTRYPDLTTGWQGLQDLEWLELSNTRLTDQGVGKLVAIVEDGKPYGKVFKQLEYLALSMTNGVGPTAVRQVRVKYGFEAPLPNAQRTLAKSNSVALAAQSWVIRFLPSKDRQLQPPTRSWEQVRVINYVAQYTKEMAAANAQMARSDGGPPVAPPAAAVSKRPKLS